jgi:DNA-binding LytR/AlgR family response regulator
MAKQSAPFFFVRQEKRHVKIEFADIRYVEASKNYVQIVTGDKRYQVLGTLGYLERLLPPEQFIRIYRSFLVRVEQVTSFDTRHAWVAGRQVPIGAPTSEPIP